MPPVCDSSEKRSSAFEWAFQPRQSAWWRASDTSQSAEQQICLTPTHRTGSLHQRISCTACGSNRRLRICLGFPFGCKWREENICRGFNLVVGMEKEGRLTWWLESSCRLILPVHRSLDGSQELLQNCQCMQHLHLPKEDIGELHLSGSQPLCDAGKEFNVSNQISWAMIWTQCNAYQLINFFLAVIPQIGNQSTGQLSLDAFLGRLLSNDNYARCAKVALLQSSYLRKWEVLIGSTVWGIFFLLLGASRVIFCISALRESLCINVSVTKSSFFQMLIEHWVLQTEKEYYL